MKLYTHSSLFIIFLLFANNALGNCASYYSIINKAEKEIVDSNYAGALALYDSAFKINAYASDYFNAGFCALLDHKQKLSASYFSKYLMKGASYTYLASELARNFPDIDKEYVKNLESYKANRCTSYAMLNMLDSLLKVDQYYHNMRLQGADSIQVYDRLNYEYLMSYIGKNGFPAEGQCVLDPDNLALPGCYILFRHFIQAGIFTNDDLNILIEAVCDNKLPPEVLSDDLDLYYHKGMFGNDIIIKVVVSDELKKEDSAGSKFYDQNDLWILKTGLINKEEIAVNRSRYHMEPLDDFLNKIKFILTTDKPFILHAPYILRSYINNFEDAKMELSSYEPLIH